MARSSCLLLRPVGTTCKLNPDPKSSKRWTICPANRPMKPNGPRLSWIGTALCRRATSFDSPCPFASSVFWLGDLFHVHHGCLVSSERSTCCRTIRDGDRPSPIAGQYATRPTNAQEARRRSTFTRNPTSSPSRHEGAITPQRGKNTRRNGHESSRTNAVASHGSDPRGTKFP